MHTFENRTSIEELKLINWCVVRFCSWYGGLDCYTHVCHRTADIVKGLLASDNESRTLSSVIRVHGKGILLVCELVGLLACALACFMLPVLKLTPGFSWGLPDLSRALEEPRLRSGRA